ncbi:hypothetical protein DPMN_190827 [Dreissena polymorpha]|uniref:Uncharacterized protein n=1 Tax=Dreissena polymorpha TaxID=45954 RepID=A0A9D4BBK0_DREPO|nr:hypothetical protein DPMN_190827 [Dreissena polymorpha]
MTSNNGQNSVIRRVSVSATNVPNFATIFKGVCERRPLNVYVKTSIVTSSAGIPYNGSRSAVAGGKVVDR